MAGLLQSRLKANEENHLRNLERRVTEHLDLSALLTRAPYRKVPIVLKKSANWRFWIGQCDRRTGA